MQDTIRSESEEVRREIQRLKDIIVELVGEKKGFSPH